ncbi:MAG: extracellular solute-binding protein [Rhodospirillaceae bacterium]|nr:extracellular solute-binding protein [Rhodospirillaceae bacterium]
MAAGFGAACAPLPLRRASSSSGELRWLAWDDAAPRPLVERFQADTGIRLSVATYAASEELPARLRAARGGRFDICSPTLTRVPVLAREGLLQPLDEARLPDLGNIMPGMMKHAADFGAIIEGRRYACPYDWRTEALAFKREAVDLEYGKASFGDLWDRAYEGRMTCRLSTVLLSTGLWLERKGDLPEGAMRKAYDQEAAFDAAYGATARYVAAHKDHIGALWDGTADVRAAFEDKGCVIGQSGDGPILQLRNEGRPYGYVAPIEGALTWLNGIALCAGATNLDQAYAFIEWTLQPEIGAILADATGYNSVVAGFERHVQPAFRRNFQEAYPGEAIQRLWFMGIEQPWFIRKLRQTVDKLAAA